MREREAEPNHTHTGNTAATGGAHTPTQTTIKQISPYLKLQVKIWAQLVPERERERKGPNTHTPATRRRRAAAPGPQTPRPHQSPGTLNQKLNQAHIITTSRNGHDTELQHKPISSPHRFFAFLPFLWLALGASGRMGCPRKNHERRAYHGKGNLSEHSNSARQLRTSAAPRRCLPEPQ